jgi:hypothetical protein
MPEATMTFTSTPHDFDFFVGPWQVRHRRLTERLTGCDDWEHFDGHTQMWPLLGGHGNVDDNLLHLPTGPYRAVSMRTFDAATGQWSIWWVDGRHPHRLDPPVVGGFAAGVGEFLCDDELRGQPIRVRFRWTRTDTPSPRWEQAFSGDGGRTWETNWVMDFSRPPAGG